MKFATPTDLCKVDPLRGGSIFSGNKDDDEKTKKKDSKKGRVRSQFDRVPSTFCHVS